MPGAAWRGVLADALEESGKLQEAVALRGRGRWECFNVPRIGDRVGWFAYVLPVILVDLGVVRLRRLYPRCGYSRCVMLPASHRGVTYLAGHWVCLYAENDIHVLDCRGVWCGKPLDLPSLADIFGVKDAAAQRGTIND